MKPEIKVSWLQVHSGHGKSRTTESCIRVRVVAAASPPQDLNFKHGEGVSQTKARNESRTREIVRNWCSLQGVEKRGGRGD